MSIQRYELNTGDTVKSPAGRVLQVANIFVPKNTRGSLHQVPAQFRNMNRKIVVFENGSIAPLKEIQMHYKLSNSQ